MEQISVTLKADYEYQEKSGDVIKVSNDYCVNSFLKLRYPLSAMSSMKIIAQLNSA